MKGRKFVTHCLSPLVPLLKIAVGKETVRVSVS
jgi:hypothetical protein